jgi:hypothetical protein
LELTDELDAPTRSFQGARRRVVKGMLATRHQADGQSGTIAATGSSGQPEPQSGSHVS